MAGDALIVEVAHRFAGGPGIEIRFEHPLPPASILVLFGPSGAGKTTVLRAIAGLLRPDRGRIACGAETWFDSDHGRFVAPQNRRIGYVAQAPALFPHLDVRANVEYGIESARERRARTDALLTLLRIADLAPRFPRELSGGEAQRVALARALARKPALVLLDEPFAALDEPLRRQFRRDVRALIGSTGARAVLVTHDRLEAMAMGDSVAVLTGGRVRQIGPVADVFGRPADPLVARAVGVESVLPAVVSDNRDGLVTLAVGDASLVAVSDAALPSGTEVFACIRAEDVVVEPRRSTAGSARNHLDGVVVSIEPEGPVDRIAIDCGMIVVALITRRSRDELGLSPGVRVAAAVKATAIHLVVRP